MLSRYRIVKARHHTYYHIERRGWLFWNLEALESSLEDAERRIRRLAKQAAKPELKVFATYAKYGTRIAPPESAGPLREGMGLEAQSRKGNSRLEIVPRASALTPEGE